MSLEELRLDFAIKQKKGLHIIVASIFIWGAILLVHLTELPIVTKNLLTFCATVPLLPISFIISRIVKIDFQNKENPLSNLGLLFSANQMLYLLIAMWVYPTIPDKLLMVIAMIFGAHLLPYGWLYKSKSYTAVAIVTPILSLVIGINYEPYMVAFTMMIIAVLFSITLIAENRAILFNSKLNRA